MKNSKETIRIRTHNIPACDAVPQPTAPPRARNTFIYIKDRNVIYRMRLQTNFGGHYITNAKHTLTFWHRSFTFNSSKSPT